MKLQHWARTAGAVFLAGAAAALGDGAPQLQTHYGNVICLDEANPEHEGYYGAGVGLVSYGASTWESLRYNVASNRYEAVTYETAGGLRLVHSAYGQPVESEVSQYSLGDVIPAPEGADTSRAPAGFSPVQVGNNTNAYWQNESGSMIWLPSRRELVAAAGGSTTVQWAGTTGTVLYVVSTIPSKRPARIFWTQPPYDAPVVYLTANNVQVYATLHYNNYVKAPVRTVVTNYDAAGMATEVKTNLTKGVWIDGDGTAKCLRATDAEGILLLEYYADGKYEQSLGVQPVQVLAPTIETINANVGDRLLPNDRYYDVDDLYPTVKAGLGGGTMDKLYLVDEDGGYKAKANWLYAVRATEQTEWDAEVYWFHKDERGVEWPFEVDWFNIRWPYDMIRVAMDGTEASTPTHLPTGCSMELVSQATASAPKQESLIAGFSADKTKLNFLQPGYVLMRYSTPEDFWFDALQGVQHDDPAEYDATAVDWPIGEELLPFSEINHVLRFDGSTYAEGDYARGIGTNGSFTAEAWAYCEKDTKEEAPILSRYTGKTDTGGWSLVFTKNGNLGFRYGSGDLVESTNALDYRGRWVHVALAANPSGGTLKFYVNGAEAASCGGPNLEKGSLEKRQLQFGRDKRTGHLFAGMIDEVRVWNEVRSQESIQSNMMRQIDYPVLGMTEAYPMDEGRGQYLRDILDGSYATIHGTAKWLASFHLADDSTLKDMQNFPGYVYSGTAYNVGRYHYPSNWAEHYDSHIFAVNTNAMEIWWGRRSSSTGMPYVVFYPSLVLHYTTKWFGERRPEIALFSGKGSDTNELLHPVIYVQNDAKAPGYNPNEEHAVVLEDKVYAFRDDLNVAGKSEPYVLVDDEGLDGRPVMNVFRVVRTNATYPGGVIATEAGAAVNPPLPLGAYGGCEKSTCTKGPAWRDRKLQWWAKAAGKDGGTADITMRFYYPMQEDFDFPELAAQPAAGTELPWLPTSHTGGGTGGTPIGVDYVAKWPVNTPTLQIAETLTTARGELPEIWGQSSVSVLYEQSVDNGRGHSVVLYDPAQEKTADLKKRVVDALAAAEGAAKETTSARYRFKEIPPILDQRLYFDPTRGAEGQLVLTGVNHEPLTGGAYLWPNWLTTDEKSALLALGAKLSAADQQAWTAAVNQLPLNTMQEITGQESYVNAALSAAAASNAAAAGYVTLAFNDSTNTARVPSSLPVSLKVIRVVPELYGSTYLDVIAPLNALEERLSLRYPDDFGGKAEDYEFEWRWEEPVAGREPGSEKDTWEPYFNRIGSVSNGAMGITIEGGSSLSTAFMLADHYFAVRYRRADGQGPTGTNWSRWVSSLAQGWIQRVMTSINPYTQRMQDMTKYEPGLGLSLIEQCGGPYEGPVALNESSMTSAGLIQIYETVFDRALSLTLRAGFTDANCNDSLLFAATRLCKLYMVLGNEAYADAQDPTVAIDPNTGEWYDNYRLWETSLFCFENQVPNLLEEELALLRGRDGSSAPSVEVSPVYNRLMWNFTHGLDGGEVAYACNYNIVGTATNTTGVFGVEDAKRMYPQGHGDAWGHYLSALRPYYTLLAYTNFTWNTLPGATLVGNATVGVDYFDESQFVEAAAAKARTGADIVNLEMRRGYVAGVDGLERFTRDSDTNRQWDAEGWACRAGQGAYYDWAVANSLLLDTVTNLTQVGGEDMEATGLNVIDRQSVGGIDEIASVLNGIQRKMDERDLGRNPLGLEDDVLVFDLSASELDEGKTHFEQVYERAVQALKNAATTFSVAQEASEALRAQYDSAVNAVTEAQEEMLGHKARLIELYGYPYADDIGVTGTYAQGYDGPDLVNYAVLDLDETLGKAPVQNLTVTTVVYTLQANYNADGALNPIALTTNRTMTLTNTFNSLGLRVKPDAWKGRRRAQGEIQEAMYAFVQAYYEYLKGVQEYQIAMGGLETQVQNFSALCTQKSEEVSNNQKIADKQKYINNVTAALSFFSTMSELYNTLQKAAMDAASEGLPNVVATVFGGITTAAAKSAMETGGWIAWGASATASAILKYAHETDALVNQNKITDWQTAVQTNAVLAEVANTARTLLDTMATQYAAIDEIQIRLTAMQAAEQQVLTRIAEGEREALALARARNRIAQLAEQDLYSDMLYRTFRNEALAKYASMQDLASKYAYLAAQAYDYETGLLNKDGTSAASQFLTGIVKSRALGVLRDDVPQVATDSGTGDGGVANYLARLKANWDAVKGRFGMNNPDSAQTRISLRKELMRISAASSSNDRWKAALETYRVDDLNQIPEYTEYCVPFSEGTNAEPGIVIPFSSEIIAGRNFFGEPLGGGDSYFDPTWLSTKIRSVGVWFSGYNSSFNTNSTVGGGLVMTPSVYLIPAGLDTMVNGMDRDRRGLRKWNVYEQVLPIPYSLSETDVTTSGWLPLFRSVSGSFSDRRRHSSFRAHHDAGTFADEDLCSNARLVGRSVWNSRWMLIIPGRALLNDPEEGIQRFIYGAKQSDGRRDGNGVTDIRLYFKTYSYSGD